MKEFMLKFPKKSRRNIKIVIVLLMLISVNWPYPLGYFAPILFGAAFLFFFIASRFCPTPEQVAAEKERARRAEEQEIEREMRKLELERLRASAETARERGWMDAAASSEVEKAKNQRAHYAQLTREARTARAERARERCSDKSKSTEFFNKTLADLPRVPVELAPCSFARDIEPDYSSVKFAPITEKTILEKVSDFTVIDVETTGVDPYKNDIVQLCAVRFKSFKPVDGFATYIKPPRGINAEAAEINGITADIVADAPGIDQVINAFRAYIGDKTPLVGHNIIFDLKFLCESGCISLNTKRKFYDTLDLSRRTYDLPRYKLDYIDTELLGIDRTDAHDALSDCLATGMLFHQICVDRQQN